MTTNERNEIEAIAKSCDNFTEFVDNVGWMSWMSEYTETEEGEMIPEKDIEEINSFLREVWNEVKSQKYIIEMYEDGKMTGYADARGLAHATREGARVFDSYEDAEWMAESMCEEFNRQSWNGDITAEVVEVIE